MTRSVKKRIERWLGLDMPRVEVDGLKIAIYGPDVRAIQRRKAIVNVATSPLMVGVISAVIAGIILKLIGAV
jgi:hypothetical protein